MTEHVKTEPHEVRAWAAAWVLVHWRDLSRELNKLRDTDDPVERLSHMMAAIALLDDFKRSLESTIPERTA